MNMQRLTLKQWIKRCWITHKCFACEHHFTRRKLLEYYWWDKGAMKEKSLWRVYCYLCKNYSQCAHAAIRPPEHPDYEVPQEGEE